MNTQTLSAPAELFHALADLIQSSSEDIVITSLAGGYADFHDARNPDCKWYAKTKNSFKAVRKNSLRRIQS